MNSLAARLRRLARSLDEGELRRLCLVRDPRLPISPKARITNQLLRDLQAKGARIVRPRPEVVAAMDAMKRILSEATSGDLSLRGEPVEAQRVREWLAKSLPAASARCSIHLFPARLPPRATRLSNCCRK